MLYCYLIYRKYNFGWVSGTAHGVIARRGREMKEEKSVLGLSTIRRNRGISLEQIAESTKISIRSLEAIEQGDFRKLPGGIYNTSYIRQYARAIEYDECALIAFYTREMARLMARRTTAGMAAAVYGGLRPASSIMGSLRPAFPHSNQPTKRALRNVQSAIMPDTFTTGFTLRRTPTPRQPRIYRRRGAFPRARSGRQQRDLSTGGRGAPAHPAGQEPAGTGDHRLRQSLIALRQLVHTQRAI